MHVLHPAGTASVDVMNALLRRTHPAYVGRLALLLVAVLLVTACGGADSTDATADATPVATLAPTTPGEQFEGTIGGDPTLEGGCVWLDTGAERYELQLPEGFTVDREAITISGPDEIAFAEGDEVTIVGDVVEDMMTVCQVGPVLDVADISADG